jgi:predicted enzyme related to lactoylglutathione lyase
MNELDTRDFDGARRFYGEVFGWEVVPIEQDGQVVYGSVQLNGRLVAGMLPMGAQFPAGVPNHWRPYFGVEDLDASAAEVRELGGQLLTEPMAVPQGRFIAAADPNGATFSLMQAEYDPPPGA